MQSKTQSLVEVAASTAFAFCLSVCVQEYMVTPIWHLPTSMGANVAITTLYTVISLVRSYYTRRFFNWLHRSKA